MKACIHIEQCRTSQLGKTIDQVSMVLRDNSKGKDASQIPYQNQVPVEVLYDLNDPASS